MQEFKEEARKVFCHTKWSGEMGSENSLEHLRRLSTGYHQSKDKDMFGKGLADTVR